MRVTRSLLAAVLLLLIGGAPSARAAGSIEGHDHGRQVEVLDKRGSVGASARSAATPERARGSFNRFGTPRSLVGENGPLAANVAGDTPEAVAREYLRRNEALFGLDAGEVDALKLVVVQDLAPGGHVVLLAQRIGGLDVTHDGLVSVAVSGNAVQYVSSSLTPTTTIAGEQKLTAQEAWLRGARGADVGVDAGDLGDLSAERGWATFDVTGLDEPGRARLVALPIPGGPARRAFEVNVFDTKPEPLGFTAFVDAETGELLLRTNRLDRAADQPNWKFFQNTPPLDGEDDDTRTIGCFPTGDAAPVGPCELDLRTTGPAAPAPWDAFLGNPVATRTTNGNNADTGLSSLNPRGPVGPDRVRPISVQRDYISPWTDAWRNAKCDPANLVGGPAPTGGTDANDINAAIVSLFSNHNRMHDWSYNLGFTERTFNAQANNFGRGGAQGDPEIGNAQAGSVTGAFPTYEGRDNANQSTPQDGLPPSSNMYLWQPIGGAFYPPCVDGDFDQSVIAHEYTHAISNRMVGGPNSGLTSSADGQARAMGESWSDLAAIEFLAEHRLAPVEDENPFAVGPYVTGSKQKGIRNYGMNASPLNYSNVQGYDGSGGSSPHDDGEIWSAANFAIRQRLIDRHGNGNAATQLSCARGATPVTSCPGNRRWMQLVFDAFLLQQSDTTMLDARDALLAADRTRFGGANQADIWAGFAQRGFGEKASTEDTDDPQPEADFTSPLSEEGTLRFEVVDGETGQAIRSTVYAGDYEANVTPIVDTVPDTPKGDRAGFVPGVYDFVVRAAGYGALRVRDRDVVAGRGQVVRVEMAPNLASQAAGATAGGDGVNHDNLVDDTEASTWASLAEDVGGQQVTVDLAGGAHRLTRINVSALLRVLDSDDEDDTGSQNRFTALRQFEIRTCNESGPGTCTDDPDFTEIYESSPDAFPGERPRPLSPDLNLRSFDIPDTTATHVRLVVRSNQCTGNDLYTDSTQSNDSGTPADCRQTNVIIARRDRDVRASELQVFGAESVVTARNEPATAAAPQAPAAPSAPAAAPGTGSQAPSACAAAAGFRRAGVAARTGGLRFDIARQVQAPAVVDVFRQSVGRRIIGERRVALFRSRTGPFSWNGRVNGRALGDGYYFARFRIPFGRGQTDVRRVALRRVNGRFGIRKAFYRRASCGLLTSYKLERPVFGGRTNRPLNVSFRLSEATNVTVELLRGGEVVKRLASGRREGDRTHRLRLSAEGLPRGDHQVRLRAGSVTSTLTSRRL